MGWVHSVEAWDGDELAGGLYGVAIGGLFAGESMFHHKTDGSKAAVAGLVELLSDKYAAHRLLDIQWVTSHLATLGAVAIPRDTYVERLQRAICYPLPDAFNGYR
jgi:leucyl/phenylalanyl-tRNA--protein transferase